MKKRNETNNQARRPSPDFPPMPHGSGKQESAQDFALHLAAMFRAELGEEDEQLDPVLNWDLPVFEADYQKAESDAGSDDELFRAVADFLDDKAGKEPAAADDAYDAPRSPSRAEREAQHRAEQEAQRRAEQEAQRGAEQEAQRRAEQEAQRRAEEEARRRETARKAARSIAVDPDAFTVPAEAPRFSERPGVQRERSAPRREARAGRRAENPDPTAEEPVPQERLVFFEPKQKKNSFFDSISDLESADTPARAELPAEPVRAQRRADRTEAGQPARRKQKPDKARRGEKRDSLRTEKEDRSRRTAAWTRREREDARSSAKRAASEREPTQAVLRGFSAVPFEPPTEDPSLDEIFGPLGLKTAPPDPDDSPARRGRTTRGLDEATGNRQQATGDEEQATGNRQQATGDEEQATGNRQQATGDGGTDTAPVGAAIGRPPEAEVFDEDTLRRDGTLPSAPPQAEAPAEEAPVGAAIGRPPEAPTSDEPEPAPAGAAIGRPPEAEAFDEDTLRRDGTLPSAPPQAEVPDEIPNDDRAAEMDVLGFDEPAAPTEEEISTEDAILDVLRLLGDLPAAEETPAAPEEAPSAEPEPPAAPQKAEPAPARPRRQKKRGWLRSLFAGRAPAEEAPAGAAIGRPPEVIDEATGNRQQATGDEATGNRQQATGDGGTDPSAPLRSAQDDIFDPDSSVGAAIGRPPEAEAFDEDTLSRDGTLPSAPPQAEASAEEAPVGAATGRPPESEAFDEDALRRDGTLPSAPPQAEAPAEEAPVGAAIGRPSEAPTPDETEPTPAGAAFDPLPEAESPEGLHEPASVSEEPEAAAAWDPNEPWSDDQLLAAVDELLERPFFAGSAEYTQAAAAQTEETDEAVPEQPSSEDGAPAPETAEAPGFSRREYDALTVPELFDYFGLQRDPAPAAEEADDARTTPDENAPAGISAADSPPPASQPPEIGEAPAEPTADAAAPIETAVPAAFAEPFGAAEAPAPEKDRASDHAPELWDPLSLFSEPAEEGPPPLTPLSRDTTGTLPSLEELFGPVREPEPKAPKPAVRHARPEKKRSWLKNLLGTAPVRRERPARPADEAKERAEQTAGSRQQATVFDESDTVSVGAAIGRPPEAEAFDEDTLRRDGTLPSAPPQAEAPAKEAPVGAAIGRPPEATVFDEPDTAPAGAATARPPEATVYDEPDTAPVGAVIDRPPEATVYDEPDTAPVGAVIDRPPETEAFDEDTLRRDGTLPPAPPQAESSDEAAAETPAPAAPSDGFADDWDPLALFGGQAEDAELPTWEEYLRARRAPAAAEREPERPEPNEPAAEPAEAPDTPPEPAQPLRPQNEPEPAPVWSDVLFPDRDPTLEELFGTLTPEAETVPMDLTVTAEEEAAPRKRPENEALTMADFLAAAVPAEDSAGQTLNAELPRENAREQTLSFGPTEPQTISTARENPAGLVLTWMEEKPEEAFDGEASAAPAPVQNKSAEKAAAKASARGAKRHDEIGKEERKGNRQQAAEGKRGEAAPAPGEESPEARWPEPPFGESAAVPSADARRPAAPAAEKKPRRREWRDEEVLPPEEKSILHPEEAYRVYARPLDAIGSRLILTGLFTILSLFFTLYLARNWSFLPEIFSGGVTVYILLALLGFMVLTNRRLYFTEWRDETGLRPALLLGLATVFTALDCISAARSLRPPFTVVVGALLMIELWGRYDRGLGMITTLKVLRAEQLSAGVSEVQDITKGSRGLVRTKPDVDRFMEKLETRDLTDRLLRVYTPVAAIVCLVLTLLITLGLKRDPCWTGALIFLGSVPVTGLLAYSRLFCLLARRLTDAQAALCGYHGAEVFGGEHSILIGDDDIFPTGSLTLNGFKVYNGNPDRMIAYAAAACRSSGSALDPIFEDLLVTHNGRHYTVDNFRFYDSGGIGASIQQDVVLMGSLDFMRRMGVHMDRGARVKQAVYMSLNGELAAVFAVRYNPPENLRRGLAAIAGNRHFKGILVTRTFLGTPGFLKAKFGIPTGAFSYPSTKERIRLSEAEMKRSGAQGAVLAKDSFSGFAQAAAGGRLLRSATLGAAILTVLGGLTGLILMGVLAALGAFETATALNVLLYVAAWLVPTLLLTAWIRHF